MPAVCAAGLFSLLVAISIFCVLFCPKLPHFRIQWGYPECDGIRVGIGVEVVIPYSNIGFHKSCYYFMSHFFIITGQSGDEQKAVLVPAVHC